LLTTALTGVTMKFWTLAAYEDWYKFGDDTQLRESKVRYREHLSHLGSALPRRALELAYLQGTGDALVVRVRKDQASSNLLLVLRCGDLKVGYFDLKLQYDAVKLLPAHAAALARIARSTNSRLDFTYDLAFSEIDLECNGRIEHRFLFHSRTGEPIYMTVTCRSLQWRRVKRLSRRIAFCKERYISE
jgi:hypothetical protein